MAVERTVASGKGAAAREATRTRERHVPPPVDIYETPEELVLLADLPGVQKGDLDLRLEDNILTIRAKPQSLAPGEPVEREFELQGFFRQFDISEEIDQEKITAELKHGVLTLHLPKAQKVKPRQIEVRAE